MRARGKRGLSIWSPYLSASRCVTDPDGAHHSFATCPLRGTSRITIRYLSCATRRNMRTRQARQRTVDRITFLRGSAPQSAGFSHLRKIA